MAQSKPLISQDALLGGKYRLGPVIGSGGVATVFRATHLWTERAVAIKVLDPDLPHVERLRECFLREARATVRLNHPNVVDVLDMGDDDRETAYMVMELLEGPTLRDVLVEHGALGEEDTLAILLPLINALEKSHELGIVHRDFKPENIMLTLDASGAVVPKLLDFGVAEILQDVRSRNLRSAGGVIMGTPQYMSPEQARDQRSLIGPHTDVWGVGVVWYECLTGQVPVDGDSAIEILEAVCEAEVDFEAAPDALVPILREMLTRPIAQRVGSLTTLKTRIEEMGIEIPSTPPPDSLLSSWPSPSVGEQHAQQTLAGLGPKVAPLAAAGQVTVDSELLHIPFRSNRRSAIAGLGLALAVALAAWWTVREPAVRHADESTSDSVRPSSDAEEAMPSNAAPAPRDETARAAEPAPQLHEDEATTPTPDASGESDDQVQDPSSSPRARRKSHPVRRRSPAPTKRSRYEEPPALVTEW